MHKSKKKTAKLPKPIKVKKEKNDEDRLPQPMTHYIDDRLELVKQVFGSLKPKTISNLAPDFLKSQGLEDIEEACLNELLCISTKRLKSIISATRCPSDTESSDDDDDVQRKEEHVSLEEISSDSELESGTSKKGKKKRTSKTGDKEKTGAKNDAPKTTDGNAEDGQISVLELLELQARARAIRSQLALEPVTKIEVDSDDDNRGEKTTKKDKKSNKTEANKNERKRTSSVRESQDSSNAISKSSSDKDAEARKTKKVKLKRNYRNSSTQNKDEDNDREEERREMPTQNGKDATTEKNHSQENGQKSDQANEAEKIKRERSSRSPSPDVIPIVAETETLLINDSSDDDGECNSVEPIKPVESDNANKTTDQEPPTEVTRDRKKSEAEEGELNNSDGSHDDVDNIQPSRNSQELEKHVEDSIQEPGPQSENDNNKSTPSNGESENTHSSHSPGKESNTIIDKSSSPANKGTVTATANAPAVEEEDEDQNDDVISLGEDLEDEMDEQLESEVNTRRSSFVTENTDKNSPEPTKKSKKKKSAVTFNEEDRSADSQSWHSRYMKSSKVSKVLAASRLGKRVRDKIKKSKDAPRESTEKSEKEEDVFTSKHEEGSLEQYKEILELRQRKSK